MIMRRKLSSRIILIAYVVVLFAKRVSRAVRVEPEDTAEVLQPPAVVNIPRHEECVHSLLLHGETGVCRPSTSCTGRSLGISKDPGSEMCARTVIDDSGNDDGEDEIVCCAHLYDLREDVPADVMPGDATLSPEEEVGDDGAKPVKAPQIGGMLGVEIEIRYVRVVESHDLAKSQNKNTKRYAKPRCVLNGRPMWRFEGGIVAADQVLPSPFDPRAMKTEGCAEYVSDPIPVSRFIAGIKRVGRGIEADMAKLSTMRAPIASTMDAVGGCVERSVPAYAKLLPPPGLPAPQLTFSTSLAGLNLLDIESVFHSQKARETWTECKVWCRDRAVEFCASCDTRNANAFEAFCTLSCHYGVSHKTNGRLRKPGCKETPKILIKNALQDVFLSVMEYETDAYNGLQDLFDSLVGDRRGDDGAGSVDRKGSFPTYIECLSRANFGETQEEGNGAQYRGESAKCVDWDYHGQCYAGNPEQYPNLLPGTMTARVLERGEIYRRRGFCAASDFHDKGECSNVQTLVIAEIRESSSPVVQGLHASATSTNALVGNLASGRTGPAFKDFLAALKAIG